MKKNYNKSKILCACTNCKKSNYCLTELACYKVFNKINCPNDSYCYGCFNNHIQALQCNLNSSGLKIRCCTNSNYCNLKLIDNLDDTKSENSLMLLKIVCFAIISCLIILLAVLSIILFYKRRNSRSKNNLISKIKPKIQCNKENYFINNLKINPVESEQSSLSEISYTSSGDGPGELIQRTISRDIYIDYVKGQIGRGRYGVVWSARWNDDSVAVKVFFSMHEQSWSRETEIYQTCMLRHENILGYIASDIKAMSCTVNMLLITDYHTLGSLYDYLTQNIIDKNQLFKFMYSIINGLNHLHNEIFSSKYKPIVVHRDLKTKNILVKKNMECCLADFGLAVRFDSQTNKMDYGLNTIREGSVRYMAPEILNGTINFDSINELKSTDIYALALTIWEMLIRVDLNLNDDKVEEHRPPYFEYIQGDPLVDRMREIVCTNKIRPTSHRFEKFNEKDKDLKILIEIMYECWKDDSSARLTSLNIKKKIKKIIDNCS